MLYYDQINISQGTYINKSDSLYEYKICYSIFFFIEVSNFQANLCDGWRDLLQKAISSNEIASCCKLFSKEMHI